MSLTLLLIAIKRFVKNNPFPVVAIILGLLIIILFNE
ncbi:MAG: hypothetical protein KatS3mg101_0077 [Patescibacteria group bacterium]|nr:MAG: hypothetical protein KatS3mg101_0077 [Patescibacteria group bacterium]